MWESLELLALAPGPGTLEETACDARQVILSPTAPRGNDGRSRSTIA